MKHPISLLWIAQPLILKQNFLEIAYDCEYKQNLLLSFIFVNLSCKNAKESKIFRESLILGLYGYIAWTIVTTKYPPRNPN